MSYFFAFLLFWAPLCLVGGAKKYFFGALYKNSDGTASRVVSAAEIRAWKRADLVSHGATLHFFINVKQKVQQGRKVHPAPD